MIPLKVVTTPSYVLTSSLHWLFSTSQFFDKFHSSLIILFVISSFIWNKKEMKYSNFTYYFLIVNRMSQSSHSRVKCSIFFPSFLPSSKQKPQKLYWQHHFSLVINRLKKTKNCVLSACRFWNEFHVTIIFTYAKIYNIFSWKKKTNEHSFP